MWTLDSRTKVQLEEDGGGSTEQRWMEKSSLWHMLHQERQGVNQTSQVKFIQHKLHVFI